VKKLISLLSFSLAFCVSTVFAVSPAEEKAFIDAFKSAIEKNDKKKLQSFIYKENAFPMALEMYQMMVTMGADGQVTNRVTKIELSDLTDDDRKKIEQPGPDGKVRKPNAPIVKKLSYSVSRKHKEGSSEGTSSVFLGEVKGKLVIAVPSQ
jgi:hypothetical protein